MHWIATRLKHHHKNSPVAFFVRINMNDLVYFFFTRVLMIVKHLKLEIMRTVKTSKIILALLVVTCLVSCSIEKIADDLLATECDDLDRFGEASIALGFYQKALENYAENQSAENCQELKESGAEYIDAVERYRDCTPDGNAEIDSELNEAKAALANLEC